jgi:RHS repeat-associated protein
MLLSTLIAVPTVAEVDPSSGTLDDVPGATPGELGEADLTELQYADPTESLTIVAPPEPNNDGSARLSYPLQVPAGRAGVQPDLAVQYDSSGGNGWMGSGWDLVVSQIVVDTTYGAPRFDALLESETYALDGDRLSPNAIREVGQLGNRNTTGVRADFVRQVEDEHERIVRHGNTPTSYVWQVTDKLGTDRWYGGYPQYNADGTTTIVEVEVATVSAAAAGSAGAGDSRWGLVYTEDVSGNVMRVTWDLDTSVRIGRSANTSGISWYPEKIEWTGTIIDGLPDQPAYRATFVRDDGRQDVGVDARGGIPVVTADVLTDVRFEWLAWDDAADITPTPTVIGGHRFVYDGSGPYDKTLLTRIGQFGTDDAVWAWHDLNYFDEVTNGSGVYTGFAAGEQWGSVPATATRDQRDTDAVNIAATSALGSGFRGGGGGGAYIGFNPFFANKIGSFGGSFNISGGQSGDLSSLMDLDGDQLPDKVTLDGSTVYWERNLSATSTTGNRFAAREALTGIESLGVSRDLRVDIHFEAYPVATIQVGGGFGFGWTVRYFDDVNGDGLVDFIKPDGAGQVVYFGTMVNGTPTYVKESVLTEVPLAPFDSDIASAPIDGIQDLLVDSSPRIDTVRRWVAPFSGTVSVVGTITRDTDTPGDGTRVFVEHAGTQIFDAVLTETSASMSHILTRTVAKGDAIYFRVNAISNGSGDLVTWAPTITYVDGSGTPLALPVDANGYDQGSYDAAGDFTTFGRSGGRTALVDAGPATLSVDLARAGALSDDVVVVARHYNNSTGVVTTLTPTGTSTLPAGGADATPADVTATFDFVISAIGTDDRGTPADTSDDAADPDWIEVDVLTNTPVDVRALLIGLDLVTTPAGGAPPDTTNPGGVDIPTSDGPVIFPNVRVFARTDIDAAYTPYTPSADETVALDVVVSGPPLRSLIEELVTPPGSQITSTAVATVKRENTDGVVEIIATSAPFTVAHDLASASGSYQLYGATTLTFDATDGDDHYVEVSVHNPVVGAAVSTAMTYQQPASDTDPPTPFSATVQHTPARQNVFPSDHRGWAIAGYNSDHPENPSGDAPIPADAWDFAPPGGSSSFDEDTPIPSGDDVDPADVTADISSRFTRSFAYAPWSGPSGGIADRWRSTDKATLYGTATELRAGRLGDDIALPGVATTPGTRPAPELMTVSGDFNIMLGLGPASISGAFGGGRSVRDLLDLNGDGFSDIRAGSNIEFTGPRGGRTVNGSFGEETLYTSVSVGGGLGGAAVSTKNETSTPSGANPGSSVEGVAPTSTNKSRGGNIGLSLGLQSEWTNPLAEGEAASGIGAVGGADLGDGVLEDTGSTATEPGVIPTEREMMDVNGDGLPDLVDTHANGSMWVNLGLGHGFDPIAIQWARGRANAVKNVSGSFGIGFQFNAYEFGGGVGFSEGAALQEMEWVDLDGDGVPERIQQIGTEEPPKTLWGAANGMEGTELTYGTYPDGAVTVDAAFEGTDIDVGPTASLGRTTALNGGVFFTIYIGPICLAFCYIIINPGFNAGYDRSWTEIDMIDVDGDGYTDVVESLSSGDVMVHRNLHGKTNLLSSIDTPLGSTFQMDYERTGNTTDQPESLWVLSELEVDDGRSGDGPDIARTTYSYSGNRYDRLLRDVLGFTTVDATQWTVSASLINPPAGTTPTATAERLWRRQYLNSTPFDSGLMTEEALWSVDAAGTPLLRRERTLTDWTFVNASVGTDLGAPVDISTLPDIGTAERLALFSAALSPRMSADEWRRIDTDLEVQSRRTAFTYDALGNSVRVDESNEDGTVADDTVTLQTFPPCTTARTSSVWSDLGTWVQVAATVEVQDSNGDALVYRDGSLDMCANAVPIRIVQTQGVDACGRTHHAVTELSFDPWGNYGSVRYPTNILSWARPGTDCGDPNLPAAPVVPTGPATFTSCAPTDPVEDGRYCVDYVYDGGRHTDVATVTDNHGVSAQATYDPLTGRLASRTDEAGHTTVYTYDAQGRAATIRTPREAATARPTVAYTYALTPTTAGPATGAGALAAGFPAHVWATAHYFDAFLSDGTAAADTIDTATFVDGIGRTVQRKREAAVAGVAGDALVVEGAVEFDALGREVLEWYPVVESAVAWPPAGLPAHLTTYNTLSSSLPTAQTNVPVTDPTISTWDIFDRLTSETAPDGSVQSYDYDVAADPTTGSLVSASTVTDPIGKTETRYTDVRGAVLTLSQAGAPITVTGTEPDPLAALGAPGISATSRIAASAGTPGALVTTYHYDALARLIGSVDPGGAVTTHTYDLLGNRMSTTTPDSGLTEWFHTPAGETGAIVDEVRRALGTAVTYQFDRDRPVGVFHPDDTPDVTYEYGAPGTRAANDAGRVARVVDGAMTRVYNYDVDGNVDSEAATRLTDPFGIGQTEPQPTFTTAWTYDSMARVRTLTYPEGEVVTTGYDAGGRPAVLQSLAPQDDRYDQFGAAVPQADLPITYISATGYDEFGQVVSTTTGTGVTTTYDRDPDRRFLTEVTTDSVAQLQFDGSMSTTRELQRLRYRYDKVGHVLDVVNALFDDGTATTLADLGTPSENNVPGAAQQSYTYDPQYRLTGAVARYVDQRETRDATYGVDRAPNNNLLWKTQATTTTGTTGKGGGGNGNGGGGNGNGNSKKNNGPGSNSLDSTPTNSCDGDTGTGGGSANQDPSTTYTLGADDMVYDATSPHRLVQAGDRTYTYDVNGNLSKWVQPCSSGANDLVRDYEFDAQNRVTYLGQGNNDTDYRYNAEGSRALERGPGGVTFFVNEHWRVVNDGHRHAELFLGEINVATHRTSPAGPPPPPCDPLVDPDGCICDPTTMVCSCSDAATCCTATTGTYDAATNTCTPHPDLNITFYHRDLQGSLRVATDAVGDVFQYVEYLPTGQPWVAGQSKIKDTPYLYAGGWTDPTYSLVNFGSRWFSPREEAFISPEPLLTEDPDSAVGDPGLLAAYTYASANPLIWVDPDGRASEPYTIASTGTVFDLGTGFAKHQKGDITISDASRENRDGPAKLGTLLLSYNADGQARAASWIEIDDAITRYTTPLAFEQSGGRKKVRIFGKTVSDKPIANQAADAGGAGQADTNLQPAQQAIPNPSPTNTGTAAVVDAPADAQGAQGQPQQAQRGRSQSLDLGTANALPPTVRPRAASDAAVGV